MILLAILFSSLAYGMDFTTEKVSFVDLNSASEPDTVDKPFCPPEHEETKRLINMFLTNVGMREQEQRRELQTKQVQTGDICLLTEEGDGEICRQISERFPWKKQRETLIRTYYKAGENYFIVNYSIDEEKGRQSVSGIQFSGQFIVQLDKELNHMELQLCIKRSSKFNTFRSRCRY